MFYKDIKKKFPKTGPIGEEGERIICHTLHEKGYKVKWNSSEKLKQDNGWDIEVNGVPGDVKNNINENGEVPIEVGSSGWLLNPIKTNKFIIHLSRYDLTTIRYSKKKMIEEVKSKLKLWEDSNRLRYKKDDKDKKKPFVYLKQSELPSFCEIMHLNDIPKAK